MNVDEPRLIELYFNRDERAIFETQAKYGAYCRHIVFGVLRDEQDSAECESDAYFQVWNSIPPKRPLCFKSYLGRIARSIAFNRLEYRSAKKRGGIDGEILGELDQMLKSDRTPEDDVMGAEMKQAVSDFLDRQSPRARVFFAHRYWYMKEISDIAALHGCSEDAVRSSLTRTRTALKEFLTEEGYL